MERYITVDLNPNGLEVLVQLHSVNILCEEVEKMNLEIHCNYQPGKVIITNVHIVGSAWARLFHLIGKNNSTYFLTLYDD